MFTFRIPHSAFRIRMLICALMFVSFIKLEAQNFSCGTPDLTPAEINNMLQQVSNPLSVSSTVAWNIPVWITLVRNDDGSGVNNSTFFPQLLINEVNAYFNNGMGFYVCGVTYVDKTNWYLLNASTEWGDLENYVNTLNSNQYTNGYINVFIVGGIESGVSGIATHPLSPVDRGSVVIAGNVAKLLAHELGHYFGLSHTHAWGGSGFQDPNHPEYQQYVDDVVSLFNPVTQQPTSYTCWQTGDAICDTDADPGNAYCALGGCMSSSCTLNDPLGKIYNPDKTLLMSYYDNCAYRFSPEQNQRMVTLYTGHPAWQFLFDNSVPACLNLPSDAGFIRRDCSSEISLGITPAKGVDIPLKDALGANCGNSLPSTDVLGRYHTYDCVFPAYSGSGLLSPLPDKSYLSQMEGVSTFDLVLISKHVLGIEPFLNPFQLIAADENNSGSVTTFDLNEIRRLLLGVKSTLTAGSCRYIPDYCFSNAAFEQEFYDDDDPVTPGLQLNPFNAIWTNPDEINGQARTYGAGALPSLPNTTSWMDHVSINPTSLAAQEEHPWSFWIVKTGDVNCNAQLEIANNALPPDETFTSVTHTPIATNQVFILNIRAMSNTPVTAWQMGVDFAEDSLQILEVLPGNSGEGFSTENFGLTHLSTGEFRALNFNTNGGTTNLNNKILFKLRVKALKPIPSIGQRFRLKNSILQEVFYAPDGDEIENIGLQLEVQTGLGAPPIAGGSNTNSTVDLTLLSCRPSPFASTLNFDFTLSGDARTTISLYDGRGRLVATKSADLPRGENTLGLDGLGTLPAGLYWYQFEAGSQVLSGKTMKY